ncbi:YqaJ viral recombinase family protein [Sorangium sp. So ce134]
MRRTSGGAAGRCAWRRRSSSRSAGSRPKRRRRSVALTADQHKLRENGIGSSDVSAIVGVNPWKTPCDVWCTKRTPSRAPLVEPMSSEQTEVGEELEEAVCRMYARRMGVKLRRSFTHVSKTRAWMMATPDRLVVGQRGGVEAKVVGLDMAEYWRDGLPDFVRTQAQWQLMVLDYEWWDVAALIGTERHIIRVHRDEEVERGIFEICDAFWRDYVLGDTAPPPVDEEDRARYLKARYRKPTGETIESTPEIEDAVTAALCASEAVKAAEEQKRRADNQILELLGERRGARGDWGSVSAPAIAGRVDWKAVAEEVTGGAIPDDVVERHRGEGYRRLGIYPKKAKA